MDLISEIAFRKTLRREDIYNANIFSITEDTVYVLVVLSTTKSVSMMCARDVPIYAIEKLYAHGFWQKHL